MDWQLLVMAINSLFDKKTNTIHSSALNTMYTIAKSCCFSAGVPGKFGDQIKTFN